MHSSAQWNAVSPSCDPDVHSRGIGQGASTRCSLSFYFTRLCPGKAYRPLFGEGRGRAVETLARNPPPFLRVFLHARGLVQTVASHSCTAEYSRETVDNPSRSGTPFIPPVACPAGLASRGRSRTKSRSCQRVPPRPPLMRRGPRVPSVTSSGGPRRGPPRKLLEARRGPPPGLRGRLPDASRTPPIRPWSRGALSRARWSRRLALSRRRRRPLESKDPRPLVHELPSPGAAW